MIPPNYLFNDGDIVYSVIFRNEDYDDPVEGIQRVYDQQLVAAFVAYTDELDAIRTVKEIYHTVGLKVGYVMEVKITEDLFPFFVNRLCHDLTQVFNVMSEVSGKIKVESLIFKIFPNVKETSYMGS